MVNDFLVVQDSGSKFEVWLGYRDVVRLRILTAIVGLGGVLSFVIEFVIMGTIISLVIFTMGALGLMTAHEMIKMSSIKIDVAARLMIVGHGRGYNCLGIEVPLNQVKEITPDGHILLVAGEKIEILCKEFDRVKPLLDAKTKSI